MPAYSSEMVAHPESGMLDLIRQDSPPFRRILSFFQGLPRASKKIRQISSENTLIYSIFSTRSKEKGRDLIFFKACKHHLKNSTTPTSPRECITKFCVRRKVFNSSEKKLVAKIKLLCITFSSLCETAL